MTFDGILMVQVIRPIWHLLEATGLQVQALLLKLGLQRFWVGKKNVGFFWRWLVILVGWLVGWLYWLVGWLVGYIGWLVGWLYWLVGWLVGWCTGGWLKLLNFLGGSLVVRQLKVGKVVTHGWWRRCILLTKIPNEMWMNFHLSHVFGNQPAAVDQPTF